MKICQVQQGPCKLIIFPGSEAKDGSFSQDIFFNNNMSYELACERDAQMKARMDDRNRTNLSWKVPEIEQINRNFNEHSRFFNTHKRERKHGLKFVPQTDHATMD